MAHTHAPAAARIKLDISKPGQPFKRLHGVNNGPVGYGSLIDVTHHFEQMAIPTVRLHDPDWPHPRAVDMYAVFPDPGADPEDPASYDFLRTDEYLASVLASGASIVYRLGVSIEHSPVKRYTHPPDDLERWARVCVGIIDHYNDRWADGFEYGIEYWEIWNEPDIGPLMWSGTPEQHLELYRTASTTIRHAHPEVKIGGPAIARVSGEYLRRFIGFCADEQLPLDFLSWHAYRDDVGSILADADRVRALLDEHGFTETESHLNEWNLFSGDFGTMWARGSELERCRIFEQQKGSEGAAFDAATLLALQDHLVDVANYYDGQPSALFCGLFDPYGVPQKPFYAFRAFRALTEAGGRLPTRVADGNGDAEGLYVGAAGSGGGDAAILISWLGHGDVDVIIDVGGLASGVAAKWQRAVVDKDNDLATVAEGTLSHSEPLIRWHAGASSVHLITLDDPHGR